MKLSKVRQLDDGSKVSLKYCTSAVLVLESVRCESYCHQSGDSDTSAFKFLPVTRACLHSIKAGNIFGSYDSDNGIPKQRSGLRTQ